MSWRLVIGDCIEAMAALPEASIDAVVCDPPYGLGFMGKAWDAAAGPGEHPGRRTAALDAVNAGNARQGGRQRAGVDYQRRQARDARAFQAWCGAWAAEALRVLKPGGHLLAFGGTRTYHRLTCAIEDAGFEVRDCLAWLYGSGFPKSLDVSKAIDKAAGVKREVIGRSSDPRYAYEFGESAAAPMGQIDPRPNAMNLKRGEITAPATPDAERWQGWGTALKPAHEPIVLARKPLAGTVAGNVLTHGTGALNVDGCRIEGESVTTTRNTALGRMNDDGWQPTPGSYETPAGGRWPANVLLDSEAAAMLDEQVGELPAGVAVNRNREPGTMSSWMGTRASQVGDDVGYGDSGGPSRFFYVAKASSAERNAGLDGFEKQCKAQLQGAAKEGELDDVSARYLSQPMANVHPTVKPIDLMRWLCRLVTPPGGVVLDPFTGSGTTGCAAVLGGFQFVGIEREAEYADIAEARIRWWAAHPEGMKLVKRLDAEKERKAATARGQDSLFDLGEAA